MAGFARFSRWIVAPPERRAILVDDERLARKELRRLLSEAHPEVHIVGEADGVGAARELIQAEAPDLMFLDIQMPGGDGFDLLASLGAARPATIFVTAYDSYAIRAFEVNALDYLLKPVEANRLAAALSRVDKPSLQTRLSTGDRLFVGTAFVKVSDVVCALAAGDYTEIHASNGSRYLVSRPMKTWENALPEQLFLRIHRGAIVNLDFVERVTQEDRGYVIHLRAGAAKVDELVVSRRYAARLRSRYFLRM